MKGLNQYTEAVAAHIREQSNFRTEQPYVGMSSIGTCLCEQYTRYTQPIQATAADYANSYRGYAFERLAKSILLGAGIYQQDSEQTLEWFPGDYSREYRGHTDGETTDGDLLEIKTLRKDKFEKVQQDRRLPWREFTQVQMYLMAGRYQSCLVFVLCPETLDFFFLEVRPVPHVQSSLLLRARVLMDAIEAGQEPACDCPRCKSK